MPSGVQYQLPGDKYHPGYLKLHLTEFPVLYILGTIEPTDIETRYPLTNLLCTFVDLEV